MVNNYPKGRQLYAPTILPPCPCYETTDRIGRNLIQAACYTHAVESNTELTSRTSHHRSRPGQVQYLLKALSAVLPLKSSLRRHGYAPCPLLSAPKLADAQSISHTLASNTFARTHLLSRTYTDHTTLCFSQSCLTLGLQLNCG